MTPGIPLRLGAAALVAVLFALLGAACSVDRDLINQLDFKCFADTDCLVGYQCIGADADAPGICREFVVNPEDCADRDQDSYLAGAECPPGTLLDCNDNEPLINPGRSEMCNGVDDNCADGIDEGIPAQPCALQAGVCAGAMAQCIGGEFQDCKAEGLYGTDFEDVNDVDESCDGLDNNCSGGYPPGAGPEEIDAQCECVPGVTPPSECGTEVGICQRGIQFCRDDGTFTDCVAASLGDTCVDDASCGANGFCLDELIDFREDLDDDCILNSDPDCMRTVCRTLLGTTACGNDNECGVDEVCVEGFCQATVQGDIPESTAGCNGLDDDCNGRIDDGGVCQPCPFGMVLLEGVPTAPQGLCMDRWEASRPDATASSAGSNELYATSREGVVPWTSVDTAEADEACRGTALNTLIPGAVTQRFLCGGEALAEACDGNEGTYPYGDTFQAGVCNDGSSDDGLRVTGDFPNCCVQVGATADTTICDLSANASEVTTNPFSGGFGGDAEATAAADLTCEVHELTNGPENLRGFRCCAPPNR